MANLTYSQIESRINECFSMAKICGFTSQELTDRLNKHVYNELGRRYSNGKGKRVYPGYMTSFAMGYARALRNMIYQNDVEFCYLVDGVLYSTHKDSKRRMTEEFYQAGKGDLLNDAEGHHYWKHKDKAFF